MEANLLAVIDNRKKFDSSIKGYNKSQVNQYLEEIKKYIKQISAEKEELEKKLVQYEDQYRIEKEEIVLNAKLEAKNIIEQADSKAEEIVHLALGEAEKIKQEADKQRFNFEKELTYKREMYMDKTYRLMERIDLYTNNQLNLMQNNIFREIEIFLTNLYNEEVKEEEITTTYWKEEEEKLLVGRIIYDDLKDAKGNIIVKKETVVTPDIIELVIQKEMYGKLIATLGKEVNENC